MAETHTDVASNPVDQRNGTIKKQKKASHPLIELTLTRVREFLREPEALFWVFVFPILLSCALGLAFRTTGPEKLLVAIESSSDSKTHSNASSIAATLARSAEIEPVVLNSEEATAGLRSGKVALIVRPRNDSESRSANDGGAVTNNPSDAKTAEFAFDYQYDPTRPESRVARLSVDDALQRALGRSDRVVAHDEKVTEPGARYIDFLIPGLIGLNLMGSGMWGLGFTIVVARGRKLLKRFAATPMRRSHYLLSFMFSRLLFLTVEVAAVLVFAWLAFGVMVRGSIGAIAIISLVGGLMFSGLGLLVAARPRTVEGVSGLMNLVMLPMWLLSGTFFSSARFPTPLQPFIKTLPLTALNDSMRAVMNDGVSLASNWPQIGVMLFWGVVSFAIALRIFRWQ